MTIENLELRVDSTLEGDTKHIYIPKNPSPIAVKDTKCEEIICI
jgi:hypothetical protein